MDQNTTEPSKAPREALAGVLYTGVAFLIWGIGPVYWKALKQVPSFEIITHRVVWSFLFLIMLIFFQSRWGEFKSILKTPRTLAILTTTSVLVSANWLVYIWAINSGHLLQASLGYYITPLINVFLGIVLLKERLRRPQAIAVLLACGAVAFRTFSYGEFPWIALALGFSFGFYGLIRKVAPVSSLVGLTVETLLLTIPAAAYLVWLESQGSGALFNISRSIDALLIGTGAFTAVPLLYFNLGARRINLATVGLMQYIAPSGMFLLAVLVYGEPFTTAQVWTFVPIWAALGIYSIDSLRAYRLVDRTSCS
jgi:chloramphenicol-sensitive protein RarD